MGYYCDVTIRCRQGAYDKVKQLWQQTEGFPRPDDIRHIDDDFYIHWIDVKWGSHYLSFNISPEEAIDTVFSSLDEIDTEKSPEMGYCVYIIGEELTDIEVRRNDYSLCIDLIREAVIPLNGEQLDPNL